jgi:hypothetical protein
MSKEPKYLLKNKVAIHRHLWDQNLSCEESLAFIYLTNTDLCEMEQKDAIEYLAKMLRCTETKAKKIMQKITQLPLFKEVSNEL